MRLAEPEGYVRLFVDEGQPVRSLLADCGVQMAGDAPGAPLQAYVVSLLAAFERQSSPAPMISPLLATNPQSRGEDLPIRHPRLQITQLVEPLTGRELDVLRLVAAGLSNAAIAEQLVVSLGTIKTHLKHLYAKLAVHSRTQAVAQAHTLGLL